MAGEVHHVNPIDWAYAYGAEAERVAARTGCPMVDRPEFMQDIRDVRVTTQETAQFWADLKWQREHLPPGPRTML